MPVFLGLSLAFFGCSSKNVISERESFVQKLEALEFLSEYHHQLHIMIGEEEGDGDKAYQEFSRKIRKLNNHELLPVKSVFYKIEKFSISSEPVLKLDYLIDYYHSGLSLQVESILRGHGYLKTFPIGSALVIYDRLQAD